MPKTVRRSAMWLRARRWALWSPSTLTALVGGSSMGSDPLSALRAACLEITVELQQATLIQFHWRVSTENRFDWLRLLYRHRASTGRISGDWGIGGNFRYGLSAGQQQLRWCYEKDRQ